MRSTSRRRITLPAAALLVGSLAVGASASSRTSSSATSGASANGSQAVQEIRTEVFSADGTISAIKGLLPQRTTAERAAAAASGAEAVSGMVPLQVNGDPATAFDLVVMGDGYTASQQDLFLKQARASMNELFSIEPYKSYRGLFNIWAVKVVSPQSGIDNDQARGVLKDTALDAAFWCQNTERVICSDNDKVLAAAKAAPANDQAIVLANSTKYGGAGGVVANISGGNAKAPQIVMHELGHTIGHLADEYDDFYYGSVLINPFAANSSPFPGVAQTALGRDWYRWLGTPSPDGGLVGTFAGASYNKVLYYRPSEKSLMRALGRQFNSPSREAMILGFYEHAQPIVGVKPKGTVLKRSATASITTATTGRSFEITWELDGKKVASGVRFLELSKLNLSPGGHLLTVTGTDRNPWVLSSDEAKAAMTSSWSWKVVP